VLIIDAFGRFWETLNTRQVSRHADEDRMTELEMRNRIIEKASEHFLKFGFTKVTMNEIATDLGMSKKTVYAHFLSKEELLSAMMNKIHADTAARVESLMGNQEMDFFEKLVNLLNVSAEFHQKITPHFLMDIRRHVPEVCKDSDDFIKTRVEAVLGSIIAEGVRKQVFRADVNEQLLTMMYLGAFQMLMRPDMLSQLPFTTHQVMDTIGRVMFTGILTDDARNRLRALRNESAPAEAPALPI
jgi:AcrR family transcriptional regulator